MEIETRSVELGNKLIITSQLINRETENRIRAARKLDRKDKRVPETSHFVQDSKGREGNLRIERTTFSIHGQPKAQVERYTPVEVGTYNEPAEETRLISTYTLYGTENGVTANAWYEYGIDKGKMYKRIHLGLGDDSTSVDEGLMVDWDEEKQREVARILELAI